MPSCASERPGGPRFDSPRALLACLACIGLTTVVPSCGKPEPPFTWARDLRAAPRDASPPLRRGDRIQVFVQGQAALSGEFVVTEAGDCLHPVLGAVRVAGLDPSAVEATLAIRLQNIVVNPIVSVRLARAAPILVDVVGEVRTPGRYEFTDGGTVTGALARAGWFTEFARTDRIFLIRKETSGTVPALRRIRFRLSDLTRPDPGAALFALHDGDLVLVE